MSSQYNIIRYNFFTVYSYTSFKMLGMMICQGHVMHSEMQKSLHQLPRYKISRMNSKSPGTIGS